MDAKFRSLGLTVLNVEGRYATLLSELSGRTYRVPTHQVDSVLSCGSPATLSEHARRIAAKQLHPGRNTTILRRILNSTPGVHARVAEKIRRDLEKMAQAGLLIGDDEIVGWLAAAGEASAHGQAHIESVCFPSRDRTESLLRSLRSFKANVDHYGREVRFIVVDDSQGDSSDKRRSVEKIGGYFLDRADRARFAETLARESRVPLETVRFAILGEAGHESTCGAARNTLLLLTAGTASLQIDDDVVCNLTANPIRAEGARLCSRGMKLGYRYFRSDSHLRSVLQSREADYVGAHERVLGLHPAQIATMLDVDAVDLSFLRRMTRPDARIITTSTGWYGDPANRDATHRLFHEGESLRRMLYDEDTYRIALVSSNVVIAPERFVVASSQGMMTLNAGFDGRKLLPPFLPVKRGSDSVFGALLDAYFKHGARGLIPDILVEHAPPEARHAPILPAKPQMRHRGMELLINSLHHNLHTNPEEALRACGAHLVELASASENEFALHLDRLILSRLTSSVNNCRRKLAENTDVPEFWRRDVEAHARRLETTIEEVSSERYRQLQAQRVGSYRRLVRDFGMLLHHWPKLYATAQVLREKETIDYLDSAPSSRMQ